MANKLVIDGATVLGSSDSAAAINCKDREGKSFILQEAIDNFVDYIYPVGSIYMSVNEVSPSLLFGGVWDKIEDKFLFASSANYANGTTGGEFEHTLTVDELAVHDGHIDGMARPTISKVTNGNPTTAYYLSATAATGKSNYGFVINHSNEAYPATLNAGEGEPHNNMPPYLAVNIWKRTG